MVIEVDPRLTSGALSHLLENAAPSSPRTARSSSPARQRPTNCASRSSTMDRDWTARARSPLERFYRGRTARRLSPGTGIGLAIARGLLAAAAAGCGPKHPRRRCQVLVVVPRRVSHVPVSDRGAGWPNASSSSTTPHLLATIAPLLRARGYEVLTAMSGHAALEAVRQTGPTWSSSISGCPTSTASTSAARIRESRSTPIVVLSARGAENDKVRALDAGADDYVTKPFGTEELLARIRVALRRIDTGSSSEPIVRGTLVIDRERFRVLVDGKEVRLTPKEFELLTYLAQRPGRVVTHRAILRAIWGPQAVDQPEHLRVLVGSLRRKIEANPSAPQYPSHRAVGRLSIHGRVSLAVQIPCP